MKTILLTTGLVTLLAGASSQAADVEKGKALVDTHCQQCHGSEVYTRSNRRVSSLPGLHKQVRFCEQNLGLTWFDDDIENTATYLNQEFYKFK
jgi:hypothetical protein